MKLYSTNNKNLKVSIRDGILKSLPEDKGLYMPVKIPELKEDFITNLDDFSFQEIAFHIAAQFFNDSIDPKTLKELTEDAVNFAAPLIKVEDKISILELFHGPTLAFKDFGARFMARIMNHYWKNENKKLNILVATSGDTGGAVAAGFYGMDNINVIILYPKGKVSKLQESQLTMWGGNISALEVNGNFDDCQNMVKEAFIDPELNQNLNLSSANSINIARLIPQTFYYFEAFKQAGLRSKLSFVVPSGNFGNLTAGLLAKKMGLPIHKMIAATNANDVFPKYIKDGHYQPARAISTLSNAMDIGNPSNFARIMDLYSSTWNKVTKNIHSYSFNDQETISQIIDTHQNHGYVLDPHTSVGYLAARNYLKENDENLILLSTAHPIKFAKEMETHISFSIPYPAKIEEQYNSIGNKKEISNTYGDLKDYLLSHHI